MPPLADSPPHGLQHGDLFLAILEVGEVTGKSPAGSQQADHFLDIQGDGMLRRGIERPLRDSPLLREERAGV